MNYSHEMGNQDRCKQVNYKYLVKHLTWISTFNFNNNKIKSNTQRSDTTNKMVHHTGEQLHHTFSKFQTQTLVRNSNGYKCEKKKSSICN